MSTLKNNLNLNLTSSQNHNAYHSLIDNYLNTPLDLLNSIKELVTIYDTDLHVVWSNRVMRKYLTGRNIQSEKTKCHHICGLSSTHCASCSIKQAIETKEICENERTTTDGKTWKSRAIPLLNESNDVIGILEISKDVSFQKVMEDETLDDPVESIKVSVKQCDVTVRLNSDGNCFYVSQNFTNLIYSDLDEIVGKPFMDFVVSDDRLIAKHAFEKISFPPYFTNFECRIQTNEGVKWYVWSGRAIIDNNQEIASYVLIGRDISLQKGIESELFDKKKSYEKLNEQLVLQNENYQKITRELLKRNAEIENLYHRLKESEERFRNMFVKHSSIMFLFDPSTYEIIDANFAAQHFYGYSEDEFLSKSLMDLHLVDKDEIEKRFKKAKDRNHQYVTFKHVLANGNVRDVEVYSVPILYKEEEVNFSIVYDVTKRKKAEKKLTESKRKLKEANSSKDKFFSIIAHDLKNPFNSLIGLSDFLTYNINDISKKQLKDLIQTIGEVSRQGYSLLENLLQWSRTQMGSLKVVIEPVNVSQIIEETVLLLKNNADTKEVEIIVEGCNQSTAMADANMIATVIRNLLANAIKYSFRNGKVFVQCHQNMSEILVSVIDEGKGIAREDLKKLFRIDENISTLGTEKETGTGLGLILCREFIERCKGTFYVESNPGQGSTFTFSLPLSST